jgi:hypothetical protein
MQDTLDAASRFAIQSYDWAATALNSNFSIAAVGGLVGAFGGAMGAQQIVEVSRRRQAITSDINAINSAVMLSLAVCNTALGFKKQLVGPLYTVFVEQKRRFLEAFESFKAGSPMPAQFHFTADLTTFQAPVIPTEALRDLVLLKSSGYGKATVLVPLVENAAIGLQASIAKRDELISRFKSGQISDAERHWFYFGVKAPDGHQHREYSDIVEVMHSYNNDLIYFSVALCEALSEYGKSLVSRTAWSRKHAPKVHEVDFSGPRKKGLVPPDADYASFQGWIVERGHSPGK